MSTSKTGPVIAFGELLWDLLPAGRVLGGAPANFGFRLFTLGIPVLIASRVGEDDLGTEALNILKSSGLETSAIQVDRTFPTGTVNVFLGQGGIPDYVIKREVAYDQIACAEELISRASEAPLICFGTVAQRAPVSKSTLYRLLDVAAGAVKFLDINLRKNCFTPDTVVESLKRADLLKLNEDEIRTVAAVSGFRGTSIRDFCQAAVEKYSLQVCLVTLGDRGAFACSARGEEIYVPGYLIQVEDTIGSGDSFSAGFVSCLMQGLPLAECCSAGNALGALVAARKGAMGLVSREEVLQLMSSGGRRLVHPEFLGFN